MRCSRASLLVRLHNLHYHKWKPFRCISLKRCTGMAPAFVSVHHVRGQYLLAKCRYIDLWLCRRPVQSPQPTCHVPAESVTDSRVTRPSTRDCTVHPAGWTQTRSIARHTQSRPESLDPAVGSRPQTTTFAHRTPPTTVPTVTIIATGTVTSTILAHCSATVTTTVPAHRHRHRHRP